MSIEDTNIQLLKQRFAPLIKSRIPTHHTLGVDVSEMPDVLHDMIAKSAFIQEWLRVAVVSGTTVEPPYPAISQHNGAYISLLSPEEYDHWYRETQQSRDLVKNDLFVLGAIGYLDQFAYHLPSGIVYEFGSAHWGGGCKENADNHFPDFLSFIDHVQSGSWGDDQSKLVL